MEEPMPFSQWPSWMPARTASDSVPSPADPGLGSQSRALPTQGWVHSPEPCPPRVGFTVPSHAHPGLGSQSRALPIQGSGHSQFESPMPMVRIRGLSPPVRQAP
eukprot:366044-Chlamydomonas_euryale.AAC.6